MQNFNTQKYPFELHLIVIRTAIFIYAPLGHELIMFCRSIRLRKPYTLHRYILIVLPSLQAIWVSASHLTFKNWSNTVHAQVDYQLLLHARCTIDNYTRPFPRLWPRPSSRCSNNENNTIIIVEEESKTKKKQKLSKTMHRRVTVQGRRKNCVNRMPAMP